MGLALEIEPKALGKSPALHCVAAVLSRALAQSDRVVPHPTQHEWKGSFAPFLKAAGVRSYRAFMDDARSVEIGVVDDELSLTPHRNLGSKGGFELLPDLAVSLAATEWNNAAATLLRLLEVPSA